MINVLHRVFLYRGPWLQHNLVVVSKNIYHPYDLWPAQGLFCDWAFCVCVKEADNGRSDTHTHTHTEVFNEKNSAVIIFGQPPRPKKWNWGVGVVAARLIIAMNSFSVAGWAVLVSFVRSGAVSPGLKIIFWHGGLIRGCGSINVPSPGEPGAVSLL